MSGVRQSAFCAITGTTVGVMNGLQFRDELPFEPNEPGKRRIYGGEDVLAFGLAQALVEREGLSFARASEIVIASSAVTTYFAALDRGEAVADLFLWRIWLVEPGDSHRYPMKGSGTSDMLVRATTRPDCIGGTFIRVHEVYKDVQQRAEDAGYILSGRDLSKKEAPDD